MNQSPFIPNQVYKRSSIHDEFGGNRQSGISPSATNPFIFIFSGKSGAQYGYRDGWDNKNIFSYTGEGQEGDMQFVKGNLALREHKERGKRVFLFEIERNSLVKFVGELEFFDADYFETPDRNGEIRIGIRFFLKRVGAFLPVNPEQLSLNTINDEPSKLLELNIPNVTERAGLVISRVGQGAYRKRILHRWEYKCAVTEFNRLDVLIASHIVPWATSTNDERLDVNNGILLSPTYDALFDKHLISFNNDGKIILSDSIEVSAFNKIGVTGKEKIAGLSQYNFDYLRRHQEMIYNQQSS
jgi:5-methylcytosine-specific restriction protein A